MNALPLLLGVGCAAGITLIADGLRRRAPGPAPARRTPISAADRNRLLLGAAAGFGVAAATRWPVAAVLTTAAVWTLAKVLGPDREHAISVARIEAVATWTELLRDTLSSAAGLEQSIAATAKVAPAPIRHQVQALAGAVRGGVRLQDALRAFAADLNDPTADLVVRALAQAAGYHGGQLAECLTSLAATAREQAQIRLRVATKRASTRTAARVIAGTALVMIAVLVVFHQGFLARYATVTGQMVLLLVGGLFGFGFWWLAKASKMPQPPRILAEPDASVRAGSLTAPAVNLRAGAVTAPADSVAAVSR
ncbi:type II secretion system F family protein [Couchioplanes caeruleus]|uniref:Type II secretion system (T2SS) protein F n=1 Tax=Couchioplanes caeruleus TaxID=56438 RepID=A0A3N1GW57_9ACTN|nr:type II secretion system F family protein [Couchioplanes caeruleus]ROP34479.1 type II secretion system (T2SS) protein F [Couchioplanes caeruleus]